MPRSWHPAGAAGDVPTLERVGQTRRQRSARCDPLYAGDDETHVRDRGGREEEHCFTRFIYKPHWFVLAQTEGGPIEAPTAPAWGKAKALTVLNVEEVGFALLDGNVQGYAVEQKISVSPVAALPWKTTFHELAHVLLGHTSEGQRSDDERTPRDLRECEAEAVALLCCEALGLPGASEARGYIQSWWRAERDP